jgi:hypothetical protein
MMSIRQGLVNNNDIINNIRDSNSIFGSSNSFPGLNDHIEIALQLQHDFDQARPYMTSRIL